MNIHSIKLKPLVISIIIPFALAGLSVLLSGNFSRVYETVNKPSFAPPNWIFPVVWSILYLLMGISCYLIYTQKSDLKSNALYYYGLQLVINILWPVIFFRMKLFLFAFIWLCLLAVAVFLMLIYFRKIKPVAAYLQIPYMVWLVFAGVLNGAVYFLN